jgi:hypothetical protein
MAAPNHYNWQGSRFDVNGDQAMSEHGGEPLTDVLRTKRLEIVDDEGKVRAVLGTNEQGVTSLSIFDQSARLRASLDASDVSEQMNGLGIFDTSGGLQIAMGAHTISEKGSGFSCYGPNGELRADLGLHENGQAGLSFSAANKDRHIQMKAGHEGDLLFIFTDNDTPMAGLGLTEGENEEPTVAFTLADKDGRAAVVVSSGPSSDPSVRLLDRHRKVRSSFELGAYGKPGLYVLDGEGANSRSGNALDRVVEGGPLYHAILFSAALILGGIGGAWIATAASAVSGSLSAAFITGAALLALVAVLIVVRRYGW